MHSKIEDWARQLYGPFSSEKVFGWIIFKGILMDSSFSNKYNFKMISSMRICSIAAAAALKLLSASN